ncbi:cellulose binding domain-containing protein [Streptomyces sp. NPDC005728]|uniref:cellulose binding domain-containing protein n=1 Tax=Streptomyces sp. NPDC005728 TaxID=3157054 RepID=UPI0033C55B1A
MRSKRMRRKFLGSAAVVAILALVPAVALATQDDGSARRLSGSLEAGSASTWYASGTFHLANDSDTSADAWSLEFDVTGGTFENHSSWNTDTVQSGSHVTLTPKAGYPMPPGDTQDVLWGISGQGTFTLGIANCMLDGQAVEGCESDDEADQPEPEESEEPAGRPPAQADGQVPEDDQVPPEGDSESEDANGTTTGPSGLSVQAITKDEDPVLYLQMAWAAPSGDADATRRYELWVDDRLASTMYPKATDGKIEQVLPIGTSPANAMRVKIRYQTDDGTWSDFSAEQTVTIP